jgi:cytochrome c oxidase assembly factor CtaG
VDPYRWAWDLEALVLVPALTVAYLIAVRRLAPPPWRVASYLAGQALLLVAFATPLQTLSLHYLLAAHLLQNVALAEWAPALCVLGLPPALAAALQRVAIIRFLTQPWIALPVWLATYFVWHVPPLYDSALRHPSTLLHLEHACYFASGCLLWWPVLQAAPGALSSGAKALYMFIAFVLASPLGLLLTLLPSPIYSFYEHAPRIWGVSPLTDQRIAGVTMAAEEAVVFFAAFLAFLLRFLREEEAREEIEPVPF